MMKKNTHNQGFTLFIAVVVSSAVLLMSFAIADIVFKELLLTFSEKDSQLAFYAADSGIECALYWDIKEGTDQFATSSASGAVLCNNQSLTTDNVTLTKTVDGTGSGTSTFTVEYGATPCAIITVAKSYGLTGTPLAIGPITRVESRGYNTCDVNNSRRLERAIRVTY